MIRVTPSMHAYRGPVSHGPGSEQLIQHASDMVDQLAEDVAACHRFNTRFDEVESAIAGLPLASEEYAVACCRVKNARHATSRGEIGAACYELRMLARSLLSRRR